MCLYSSRDEIWNYADIPLVVKLVKLVSSSQATLFILGRKGFSLFLKKKRRNSCFSPIKLLRLIFQELLASNTKSHTCIVIYNLPHIISPKEEIGVCGARMITYYKQIIIFSALEICVCDIRIYFNRSFWWALDLMIFFFIKSFYLLFNEFVKLILCQVNYLFFTLNWLQG